ncbi:hypothetical protein [Actinoallomurus iriomotensis]|uniref:Secreted protein n=1 Tax=Actinoallomurus iriomotensis TaxID=478107 RepID=A0A9W6RN58_9ACTN|nr:hypothetical protein [Actinoallomurus iriomotensis]GLY78718.1 hypothetical protein Airi01_069850 [Actinoallomurus iriomotensis]
MRARLGWVAAILLVALAFTGGPEAIDATPTVAQGKISAELAEKRGPQVRDDLDLGHQVADHGTPGRPRLLALPPSAQTAAPVPVRAATLAMPDAVPPAVMEGGPPPRLGARTPEALQIFRC